MKLIDSVKAWENAQVAISDPFLLLAVKAVLDNAPPVVAVEVVRCEECVHSLNGGRICGGPSITMPFHPTSPEEFCFYGERRTDDL